MARRRDRRESLALKFLVAHQRATALDLGAAALSGEPGARSMEVAGDLGVKIGLHFVHRGFARVDQFNRFEWVPNA